MSENPRYSAYEAIPDPLLIVERDTLRIIYVNRAAQQITGLAWEQLHRLTLLDLLSMEQCTAVQQQLPAFENNNRAVLDFECNLIHYSGPQPPALAIKISLMPDSAPQELLVIGRDITPHSAERAAAQQMKIIYNALLSGLSDLMFRITEDGTYRDFHIPSQSGLTSPEANAIIGRKVKDVVPPNVTAVSMPAIKRVVRTGKAQIVEYSIEEADGLRYYEARFVPSLLDEIVAVVRDITERKRKAEALRFSEQMARALLNASTDSAVLIDRDWIILSMNEPAALRFNRTAEEMIGTCILDYFPPETANSRQAAARIMLETKNPLDFEDTRAGRLIANRANPILDEHGEIVQVAVFSRDITDQRQQEAALKEQHELLAGVAQANQRLLTPGNFNQTLQETLTIIGKASGVDRVYVFQHHTDPETNTSLISERGTWIKGGIGEHHHQGDPITIPWIEQGFQRWYDILQQRGLVCSATSDLPDPERATLEQDNGLFTLLVIPIHVNNTFWGFIRLDDSTNERRWSDAKLSLMRTMAASLGGAIARKQLEDDMRQKQQLAEILREIGNSLTLARTPEEVLSELLRHVRHVIDYHTANAMLLDDEKETARIIAMEGLDSLPLSQTPPTTITIDNTVYMKRMISTHKSYVSSDVLTDPNWTTIPGTDHIRSWISAPIIVNDEVRGFFSLDSMEKHTYSEEQLPLITSFAQQAAVALLNAWYMEDIKNLERFKSEIIEIAAHDLRNPLMRVQESLKQFRDDMDQQITQEQHDTLSQMVRSTSDMEHIITNILSLHRIENQHREARPVYWNELIERAIAAACEDVKIHQHTLLTNVTPNLPVTRGNPFKLERVIYNLITNAIKYTPRGGTITIRAYEKPYGVQSTLAVEVEDNGIGISPEDQANLFQPFYRAHNAHTENIPGTGLGLTMVKTAIEEHNGSVYMDSVPGQGSLFGFWLPV